MVTRATRGPLSLAFFFYLITLGAIVSTALGTLSDNELVTTQSLALMTGSGATLGGLCGWLLGIFLFRNGILSSLGMIGGTVLGCTAGALTLVSAEHFLRLNLIAVCGAWLMIVTMSLAARNRGISV